LGKGVCEHGLKKYCCSDCGGKGTCKHGRKTIVCRDCKGRQICSHGRQKHMCRDCNANTSPLKKCPHNKRRARCKECRGGSICRHDKRREFCSECKNSRHIVPTLAAQDRISRSQLWSIRIGVKLNLSEFWTATLGAAEQHYLTEPM
jgi:hypothetical protein